MGARLALVAIGVRTKRREMLKPDAGEAEAD
jgi:hypothetical protein